MSDPSSDVNVTESPGVAAPGLCGNARSSWLLGVVATMAAFAVYTWHTESKYGLGSPPTLGGDSADYDSLSWELANGRGFQTDFDREDFRDTYRSESGDLPDSLPSGGPRQLAYRPPLYPWMLSVTNRLFGRQFQAGRMINIGAMAITCGLLIGTVARLFGPCTAVIAFINFVAVDWRTRFFAREFLTESLVVLFIAVLALLLLELRRKPSLTTAIAAGVVLGLAALDRTMIALWALILVAVLWRWEARRLGNWTTAVRIPLAVLIAAMVTFSPWAIRNCRVLGEFMPLGTQGMMEMSAGYSDAAISNRGLWSNLNLGPDVTAVVGDATGLEREKRIAEHSKSKARAWALENWWKLPLLAIMKMAAELKPWGIGELYVSAFALLGLIAMRRTVYAEVGVAILLACLLSIAVTWSTAGRFLAPTLFILHLFAVVGLSVAWKAAVQGTLVSCGSKTTDEPTTGR